VLWVFIEVLPEQAQRNKEDRRSNLIKFLLATMQQV